MPPKTPPNTAAKAMDEAASGVSALPLITIGLTCYNAADTIGRALDSALAQDWPRIEVVVVDDCSTDGSAEVVAAALAGHPCGRMITLSGNGGPAVARNAILAAAQGAFVAFFDDDDVSLPGRLSAQYQRITDFEAATGNHQVFCYASGRRRYPNGYMLMMPAIGSQGAPPQGSAVADYLLFNHRLNGLFYGAGVPTCALMARTQTLRDLGGFDAALRRVEDVDLAIRLALAGGWFIGCTEELFEQYASQGLDKTPAKNLEAELALTEKFADYLRRSGSLRYAQDWFRIRYLHFSRQRLKFALALWWFLARFPLRGSHHLLRSAPGRAIHEWRISK